MYLTNICSFLCDFIQLNLFIALIGSASRLLPYLPRIQTPKNPWYLEKKKVFFHQVQKSIIKSHLDLMDASTWPCHKVICKP